MLTGNLLFMGAAIGCAVHAGKYNYPEAKKVDVTDDYHGTKIADPYRWLEDPDGEDTVEWVTCKALAALRTEPSRARARK